MTKKYAVICMQWSSWMQTIQHLSCKSYFYNSWFKPSIVHVFPINSTTFSNYLLLWITERSKDYFIGTNHWSSKAHHTKRLLIDPACQPSFVDNSSCVAKHNKTPFGTVCVLTCPCIECHSFYTATGLPTMANERSICFPRRPCPLFLRHT